MRNAPRLWKIAPQKFEDLEKQLLFNRGLHSEKEVEDFLNPTLKNYDKELNIPGIPLALKRIKKAIENKEQIVVFGDYDVDGIASCAILFKALTSLGAKVLPYIPHREKEGYGLSKLGLEFARDLGAALVITVDNGIVAIDQAEFAKEIGLDLIITDHHLPLDKKPEALAIVHSTKMCGAGVAWCLIKDLVSEVLVKDLLEFVVIATITDLIPLVGLGRAFVFEGLKELNKTKNLGLKALIKESGLELGKIGSFEIGFILGPRLNSIGRLEHAIDALRLLCTKDPQKASRLAKLCSDTNSKRQKLTEEAILEAKEKINGTNKQSFSANKKIYILDSKNWVPGIIGLVAARITEEYYQPSIAISVGEEFSKGSARSINGINIVEVIRKHSSLLIDIGGHSGAAGFSIANSSIEEFRKKLEKTFEDLPDQGEPALEIEAEVQSSKLNLLLAKKIEKLEPFGMGNPKPLLATKKVLLSDIRTVGQDLPAGRQGKHLKFKVSSSSRGAGDEGSQDINCIAFGMGQLKDMLFTGQVVDLAFVPEVNKFNGSETLQLKVKDIKIN